MKTFEQWLSNLKNTVKEEMDERNTSKPPAKLLTDKEQAMANKKTTASSRNADKKR